MEILDGLWTAEFGSTTGISGGGVVIFAGNKILEATAPITTKDLFT